MQASSAVASTAGSQARAWAASRSRRRSWQPAASSRSTWPVRLDLHPGEGPGHLLDHLEGDRPADLLAEVVQHHPAPFRVDGQRGRHVLGNSPASAPSTTRLVDEQGRGRVRLEPDVAGGRRGPQDARQLPDPDLLHRPGDGPADGRHGVLQPALGPGEPAAGRPGPAGQAGAPVLQLLDHPGGGRVGAGGGQLGPRRPRPGPRQGRAGPGGRPAGSPAGPGRRRPRAPRGSAAGRRRCRAGRAGRAGAGPGRPSRPGRSARPRAGAGSRPGGPAAPWARWDGPPPSGCGFASRRRSWRNLELAGRCRTRITRPARDQPRPADPVQPPGKAGPDAARRRR